MIKSSLFGDLSAPVRIGRFTVTEQLGSGGMGVVYAARDEELDRKVAIKLLRSDQGDQGDQGDQARARLLREARAMARLSHPNVVTIHEVGSYDDQVFLAMEYLEGEDLAACLARERRLPWAEARALALQLCDALAAMHERGLVHRDIKPHNIFLVTPPGRSSTPRRPRVKVLDFGIAKLTRADASSVHSSWRPAASWSGPPPTSRPSRRARAPSTAAPTSTPSAWCSTSSSPGACRSRRLPSWRWSRSTSASRRRRPAPSRPTPTSPMTSSG
ncbi:MAG: serine/threonine protein kinase [Myxococcales bacterium]|nr:serine/threonine protein kinase [Myxococcales bacterium]